MNQQRRLAKARGLSLYISGEGDQCYYTVVNKNRGTHSHLNTESLARFVFRNAVRRRIPHGTEPYISESIRRVW